MAAKPIVKSVVAVGRGNASSSSSAVTITVCAVDQLPVVKVSVVSLAETPEGTVSVTVTLPVGRALSLTSRLTVRPSVTSAIAGSTWIPGWSLSVTVTVTLSSTVRPS